MTDSNRPRRVFILGAGFSKPAGMPLADELTELILRQKYLLDNDEFRAWIGDISERIIQLNRASKEESTASVGFEELFEFARFDIEIWRMRQHDCIVDRNSGDTPWSTAEAISTWLRYMESGLVGVLIACERKRDPSLLLLTFANQLRDGDTVLTFNYDTILESIISAAGKRWSHGFDNAEAADITVLKLHGSVNWWLLPRGETTKGTTVLYEKKDVNRARRVEWPADRPLPGDMADEDPDLEWKYGLHRADDLSFIEQLNERFTGLSKGDPGRPGLGGLGSHKPLHRLVGSGVVWGKAFEALKKADEIFVIGWSASLFDNMARFHFRSLLALRKCPPARIVVIDPGASKNRQNYESVFDEVELIDERVEDVDWEKLLA